MNEDQKIVRGIVIAEELEKLPEPLVPVFRFGEQFGRSWGEPTQVCDVPSSRSRSCIEYPTQPVLFPVAQQINEWSPRSHLDPDYIDQLSLTEAERAEWEGAVYKLGLSGQLQSTDQYEQFQYES